MKTNKGFTIMSFLLPLAYFLILGLFFSGPTKEVCQSILVLSENYELLHNDVNVGILILSSNLSAPMISGSIFTYVFLLLIV